MRAILIGSDRDRDRLRWQLQGTGVIVVGEFVTVAAARDSAVDTDAFVVAPGAIGDAADRGRLPRAGPMTVPASALAPRSHPGTELEGVEPLTRRELEVLGLLADGLPNKAIADRLGISDQTVKFHVAQIIAKLGVANRTEAVRRAIRQGIVAV